MRERDVEWRGGREGYEEEKMKKEDEAATKDSKSQAFQVAL